MEKRSDLFLQIAFVVINPVFRIYILPMAGMSVPKGRTSHIIKGLSTLVITSGQWKFMSLITMVTYMSTR